MTDEQMRKFRRDTLMDEWPKRCKTGLMCRACGFELEAYYCEECVYLVRCAVCGTVALVEAFSPKEAAKKVGGKENERIRQTHVTHEAMQAVLGEIEKVKRELKALEADYERESAMRRHIARMHGEEIAKVGNLQNSLDAVRSDRDALNAELVQARREIKALLKIIDESRCDDEKCKICTHYQPNNSETDCALMHYLDDGNTLDGECKFEWRDPCAENGGTNADC